MRSRHISALTLSFMASLCLVACDQARSELEEMRDSVRIPDREEVSEAVDTLVEDTRAELKRLSAGGEADDGTDTDAEMDTDTAEPATPSPSAGETRDPVTAPAGAARADVFPATLRLCVMNAISNAPADRDGLILDYSPLVQAREDLVLALAPVAEACLSSGFGPRGDSLHKGIDLHHNQATAIYAAGPGTIKEIGYRNDYGNMIIIDHGGGVYTRYAHLAGFAGGLGDGTPVAMGQALGEMGNTASYRIPVHLHYELLEGDWDPEAGSFGLDPVDLFTLPAAN